MNPIHTFWVFGLGVGIGQSLITGKFGDFITGFLIAMPMWFFMILIIWPPVYQLGKWIEKKIG